jgi:hypothetical protein
LLKQSADAVATSLEDRSQRQSHHAQAPAVLDHSRTLPQGDWRAGAANSFKSDMKTSKMTAALTNGSNCPLS